MRGELDEYAHADAWGVRRLSVVVRNMDELPVHARQLVDALRRAAPTR